MPAKSTPSWLQCVTTGRLARRARKAISVLVLIGSLTTPALIIQEESGYRLGALSIRLLSMDPLEPDTVSPDAVRVGGAHSEAGRYRAIAEFLARKYKVSQEVTFDLVSIAHAAGHQVGLDPLVIIAVIAVESRFNPIAESVTGAKGLMQVIPRYHADKFEDFGGEKAVFDPQINILVGSQILKEYLKRTGNLRTALQRYAGLLSDDQDGYASKVMSEKQRIQHVVNQAQRSSPAATAFVRSAAP